MARSRSIGGSPWSGGSGGFKKGSSAKKKKKRLPLTHPAFEPTGAIAAGMAGGEEQRARMPLTSPKLEAGGAIAAGMGKTSAGQVIKQGQVMAKPAEGEMKGFEKESFYNYASRFANKYLAGEPNIITDPETGKKTQVLAGDLPLGMGGAKKTIKILDKTFSKKLRTAAQIAKHGGTTARTAAQITRSKRQMALAKWTQEHWGREGTSKEIAKIMFKNSKVMKKLTAALKLSDKSIKVLGIGAVIAAIASPVLSLWAKKETPEPISIISRDIMWNAKETGNWSLYEEMTEARDELISNISLIDYIPIIGPALNSAKAIKGMAEAARLQDKLAKTTQEYQEISSEGRINPETPITELSILQRDVLELRTNEGRTGNALYAPVSKHEEFLVERKELERSKAKIADDYNEDRISTDIAINAAKLEHNEELSALWIRHKKKILALEQQAIKDANAEYLAYQELKTEMSEGSEPSHLGFGLL